MCRGCRKAQGQAVPGCLGLLIELEQGCGHGLWGVLGANLTLKLPCQTKCGFTLSQLRPWGPGVKPHWGRLGKLSCMAGGRSLIFRWNRLTVGSPRGKPH